MRFFVSFLIASVLYAVLTYCRLNGNDHAVYLIGCLASGFTAGLFFILLGDMDD